MISKRIFKRCTLIAVVVLLASPFALPLLGFLPWSPINCRHYDVDIRSGRIRYTRYFAFVQVARRVEESALSRALYPEGNLPEPPDWRRVFTFSPGINRHSPHYFYHGAMCQMRELEYYWMDGMFTPAAQRASAKAVLELWQEDGGDDVVRPYLMAIQALVMRENSEETITDERDLPPIPR